ncbi:hypothetical protein PENSPDRAFT_650357 [Peniophora sp. CONT]|nr:hypothetical protein PENSPDRAFT_650357 [Peniophora sp. CONT]
MYGGNVLSDARSPVRRLNEDCLTALFRQAVRGKDYSLGPLQRLLCLTHVCRAWRSLALDLAELWGDVVLTTENPKLFEVLLSRARDAPLATSILLPRVLPKVHQDFVLSHADRFRRLEVIIYRC